MRLQRLHFELPRSRRLAPTYSDTLSPNKDPFRHFRQDQHSAEGVIRNECAFKTGIANREENVISDRREEQIKRSLENLIKHEYVDGKLREYDLE
jgi:hypothetical protein